jgi:hypothetical protein
MPFTAAELANIANAAMDFYIKGQALAQTMQERPLLKALKPAQKTFPGGKEFIRAQRQGRLHHGLRRLQHDDTVATPTRRT